MVIAYRKKHRENNESKEIHPKVMETIPIEISN
jgi:hypothetical protein